MTVISLSEILLNRIKACAARGESFCEAIRHVVAETGPLPIVIHNLGHAAEPAVITCAGADFLMLQTNTSKTPMLAPVSTLDWIAFDVPT